MSAQKRLLGPATHDLLAAGRDARLYAQREQRVHYIYVYYDDPPITGRPLCAQSAISRRWERWRDCRIRLLGVVRP